MTKRGNTPRVSQNPREQRMITWRLKGALFNRLVKVTAFLDMSHNRFITQAVSRAIYELEEKIEKETNND